MILLATGKRVIDHYRVLQKSLYMGKVAYLCTKGAVYGHHYVDSTYECVSSTHGELAVTHLVLRAHASLMLSFMWYGFYIFTWYIMTFKCPYK